jgi:hypothetical protein
MIRLVMPDIPYLNHAQLWHVHLMSIWFADRVAVLILLLVLAHLLLPRHWA